MMLQEYPFLERFRVAAEQGFSAVDIQFPYHEPAGRIAEAVQSSGLEVVLFNLPAGDLLDGGRGLASEPDRIDDYRQAVTQAIPYVRALGNKRVNVLAGKRDHNKDLDLHIDTLIDNLRYTLSVFEPMGVTVMVEPVNGDDVPDYLLQTMTETVQVVEALGSDSLKIQFDIYHQHKMGEDIQTALESHLPLIAHMQFADSPGRHEPGTGEIDFDGIFNKIDGLSYSAWVGAEYIPSRHTVETLDWFC